MFDVFVTPEAEQDIQDHYAWWFENRSGEQAIRWYDGIQQSMRSLERMPDRCPEAPESATVGRSIRQLFFTIGRRVTHRIVFLIEADQVKILRVRHIAQDFLADDFVDPT